MRASAARLGVARSIRMASGSMAPTRATSCEPSSRRTTWPAARRPSSRIAARTGLLATMTMVRAGDMARRKLQAPCQAAAGENSPAKSIGWALRRGAPDARRRRPGAILGRRAQRRCSRRYGGQPDCPQGRFPLVPESRPYGGAPRSRPRGADKKARRGCASTRTCTSTRNIRARPAAISISSISPPGPPARASAWSPPATSPIRPGAPSSSRSSCRPSPASTACATRSSAP